MYLKINCIVNNYYVNDRKVEPVLKDLGHQHVVSGDRFSCIEIYI